jgi:hypothetical protein
MVCPGLSGIRVRGWAEGRGGVEEGQMRGSFDCALRAPLRMTAGVRGWLTARLKPCP